MLTTDDETIAQKSIFGTRGEMVMIPRGNKFFFFPLAARKELPKPLSVRLRWPDGKGSVFYHHRQRNWKLCLTYVQDPARVIIGSKLRTGSVSRMFKIRQE